jgi:hypothetical protein
MDIETASEHLRDILDATDERYPPGVRALHLNQAINYLGRRFETAYNEGYGQIELPAGSTSFIASSLVDSGGNSIAAEVVEAMYYVRDFDEVGTNYNAWVSNEAWTKIQIYSSLESLMDVASDGADGILYGATQRGGMVFIMNAQEDDLLLKVTFNGPHVDTSSQNNWLIYAPYPVIYKAACYACVYLEDEERIPVYQHLLEDAVEVVNISDSMRNDAPASMQEA